MPLAWCSVLAVNRVVVVDHHGECEHEHVVSLVVLDGAGEV
jgi:hypothetical protein